jgi:hypothetical protein
MMGRRALGIELNARELEQFRSRLARAKDQTSPESDVAMATRAGEFRKLVLSLRVLKFARVIRKRLPKTMQKGISMIIVERLSIAPTAPFKIVSALYTVYAPGYANSSRLLKTLSDTASKPPLSKYGVESRFKVLHQELPSINGRALYVYSELNTHRHVGRMTKNSPKRKFQILSPIEMKLNEQDYA